MTDMHMFLLAIGAIVVTFFFAWMILIIVPYHPDRGKDK